MKIASLPTPKVTITLIHLSARSYFLYALPWIFLLASRTVPGLIERSIFDSLTGSAPVRLSVWALIALMISIEATRMVANLTAEYYGTTFRGESGLLMMRNLMASIFHLPGANAMRVSTGEALSRFDHDIPEIADFPTWLPDVFGHIVFSVVAFSIMFRINPTITLVVVMPLVAIVIITQIAWSRLLQYRRNSRRATDAVTGFLGETFGAVQAIKVSNGESNVIHHFEALNEVRRKAMLKNRLFNELLRSIYAHTVDLGIGITLLLAGQAMSAGTFTIGDFALFVSYLSFITQLPSVLGTFIGDYQTQAVSIQRLEDLQPGQPGQSLLEKQPNSFDKEPPALSLTPKTAVDRLVCIEATGLRYYYPGSMRGIENIHLRLPRGAFVVITGRVGAGKSTLLKVLLGLLSKDEGEIRWNGELVGNPADFMVPPRSAYTAQVPRLFSETLKENILLGLPSNQVNLPAALHAAVFENDVKRMPDGLDTLIGPKGLRLSGGQISRAAAARMFVRNPELLVFDDLSSALDVDTERLLWERLSQQKDVTCLVVSHRRAALQQADHILLLKDGKLEAEGKLNQLLACNEEMQRLWQSESSEKSRQLVANLEERI